MNSEIDTLLASDSFLFTLYHHTSIHCMLVADATGCLLHCNRAFEQTFGYKSGELQGRHLGMLFIHWDSEGTLQERAKPNFNGHHLEHQQQLLQHQNGHQIWTNTESVSTTDDQENRYTVMIIQTIAEQKTKEPVLRHAPDFSEQLIGAMRSGLLVVHQNGTIKKVNKSLAALMGKPLAPGMTIGELNLPKFAADHLSHALKAVFTMRTPRQLDLLVQAGGGKNRILAVDLTLIPETADSEVLVLFTDVTTEKAAVRQLRQSEQSFRNFIAEAPVATAVYLGEEMRIQYANGVMLKMLGKGNAILGKPFLDALPELKDQAFYDLLVQVYRTGAEYAEKEGRADLLIDGKTYSSCYHFSYKPLRNDAGEVYGVLNMALDVGDRVKAQKKLQESESNLQVLFRQAPVGLCLVEGQEAVVTIVNDTFLQLIGKRRQDVEGIGYWAALPEIRHIYASVMQQVFDTAVRYQGVEHPVPLIRNGKSELVYISFVYEPLVADDGTVNRIMIVALDVTPQVMARLKIEEIVAERTQDLALSNQNLEKSNAELAQFAYIASHDLQEPLRKIQIFSGYLQSSAMAKLNEKEGMYLEKILRATKRMSQLINDILNYSRLEATEGNNSRVPVDLNAILSGILDDLRLEITAKEATVTADLLPTIPAVEVQMNQLFYNLVANSLKFVPPGKMPHIRIRSEKLPEAAAAQLGLPNGTHYQKLSFQDNGIGFAPHYAERIFTMFQRLHAKKDYEGTGIGLAICKKVVDNHQGLIFAAAQENEGACFTILLPTQ